MPERRYIQADPSISDAKYNLKDDSFNIIGRNREFPQKSSPIIKRKYDKFNLAPVGEQLVNVNNVGRILDGFGIPG